MEKGIKKSKNSLVNCNRKEDLHIRTWKNWINTNTNEHEQDHHYLLEQTKKRIEIAHVKKKLDRHIINL